MKKAKKILVMVAALALTAAIAVGGTLAYLTSKTSVVTNTFTVGKVGITLDESLVDIYGEDYLKETGKDNDGNPVYAVVNTVDDADRVMGNAYKLVPGHEYIKDPTVHVDSDSENSWLFVKVENGIAAIEAATTIHDQMTAGDSAEWAEVATGIYAYKTQVTASQDVVVFNTFTLADNAAVDQYENAQITIQAYAIQADGFATYSDAWTTGAGASWPTT